jgi:hypothetical protein
MDDMEKTLTNWLNEAIGRINKEQKEAPRKRATRLSKKRALPTKCLVTPGRLKIDPDLDDLPF